jgi:hypothetical protein
MAGTSEAVAGRSATFAVAAAASGGTDTFIVTVTLSDAYASIGAHFDVEGGHDGSVGLAHYHEWVGHAGLASDVIYDASVTELVSEGDSVGTYLVLSAPTAVGASNQLAFTFTNTHPTRPFQGTLSMRHTTFHGHVSAISVANNQ